MITIPIPIAAVHAHWSAFLQRVRVAALPTSSEVNAGEKVIAVDVRRRRRARVLEPAIQNERKAIAKRILTDLPERDRQALLRFYVDRESAESIQQGMGLTETQFRLLKSRAKARFAELSRGGSARTTRPRSA